MVSNQLVLLVFFSAMTLTCQALCPICLPQDESWWSPCKELRKVGLDLSRERYGVRKPTTDMPYARLDKDITEYMAFLLTESFLRKHAELWIGQGIAIKAIQKAYSIFHDQYGQNMTMEDFASIKKFFRNRISSPIDLLRGYMKYPSSSEPFQSDYTKWISDKFFAEQRLAGVNPMTIERVTFSKKIGMHFNSLKKLLNPSFHWVEAVKKVLSDVTDKKSLRKAIKEGHLFVLYHPLSKDIHSMPDLTDKDPKRKMWDYKSPIAIFASRKCNAALTPVAIQMDDEKDAEVFTPQDGDNWMLAKLNMQLTDISCSQLVENLSKTHFVSEALCLSVERQLSKKHPLYDMMRFHCRGVITTNTFAGRKILHDNQFADHVAEYGNEGAVNLIRKTAEIINWHDLDLKKNLKRRGLNDKRRLPYYPYRDDGRVIYDVLESMVKDYVNIFYSISERVENDYELQNFAKEISKDGNGEIRGFPVRIKRKSILIKTFTRILWLMIGHHTAVNYALIDYGTYLPNMPFKLYDVKGVPDDTFTTERLGNRVTTSVHLSLVSILATFRLDRIFDYGRHLHTSNSTKIVNFYRKVLLKKIEPVLAKRNRKRLKQGHLTYPYMQPSWLTNGIHV